MPWGWAAAAMTVVGTVMQASAQSQQADAMRAQGAANQQAADYTARSMEIQAGQERAVAQRKAIAQRRQEGLVQSRAQALAAASGAGASDPTIISNASLITREGELGALTSMYQGEQSAQNLETGATLKRYEGASGRAGSDAMAGATDTAAAGTVFSGLGRTASLYAKYGDSGGNVDVNGNYAKMAGYSDTGSYMRDLYGAESP